MELPEFNMFLISFCIGLFATTIMTIFEIPAWRKWKLEGVLEWHENQVLSTKLFRLSESKTHVFGIFLLHFANGGLGGIGFVLALILIPDTTSNLAFAGIIYGVFLWVATLIPIHRPITGISPWRHQNGMLPMMTSLGGHLIYGITIGFVANLF